MKVIRRSPLTGEINILDLNVTEEQMIRFERREGLIQDIFPNLAPSEREFILTGYTQEDWDRMFPR